MVRRKYIITFVSTLLEKARLNKLPIRIESVAELEGIIIVKEKTNSNVSGFLYREGKKSLIGVNGAHSENRQRFTIAHELGHYFLHKTKSMHLDRYSINLRDSKSSEGTDTQEKEANFFAAELLMPRDLIYEELEKIDAIDISDDNQIKSLALKFGVSEAAMTFRLANLGYISI